MCLTTTEPSPSGRQGPPGRTRKMIAPSVTPALMGGGPASAGGAGRGGAAASRRCLEKGDPSAGADAKLTAAEYMFNYSRLRGLFYLRFRWSSEPPQEGSRL